MSSPSAKRPLLSLIAAIDRERVIGRANDIPWKLPRDQAYFRSVTMGRPVIMGRRNYESMGRPLPGRRNIVLSRSEDLTLPGCLLARSPQEALALAGEEQEEVFVIGGEDIYRLYLPLADRLYLTHIEESFGGDTYFPEWNETEWKLASEEQGVTDEHNHYRYAFCVYVRQAGYLPS